MQSLMILIALLTWIVTKNLIENDIYIYRIVVFAFSIIIFHFITKYVDYLLKDGDNKQNIKSKGKKTL